MGTLLVVIIVQDALLVREVFRLLLLLLFWLFNLYVGNVLLLSKKHLCSHLLQRNQWRRQHPLASCGNNDGNSPLDRGKPR